MGNRLNQLEAISINQLVSNDHSYRKFDRLVDFDHLSATYLSSLTHDNNYKGYVINVLFRVLLLQFLEDLSDRELAKYLAENVAAK